MAKRTLTDRLIKSLQAKPQRYEVMDNVMRGMGIRVSEHGVKTFVLVTRYPGSKNPTRRALGEYGALTLEQARTKAQEWIALVKKGVDPAAEEERARLAEQRKQATTFTAVAEDFITEKCSKERQGFEVERIIRRELMPVWGDRAIADITPIDVLAVIKPIKTRGLYIAHATFVTVRRLFSWAIEQHVYGLETSPCDRLKPKAVVGERKPRVRALSDDELRAFWRATGRMKYPLGPLARVLLLTGMRHDEVAAGRWKEIDLDAAMWKIPQERHKSETGHVVPLVNEVVDLLNGLPRFRHGDHVFSTTAGEKPTRFAYFYKEPLDARMLRTLRAMARARGRDPKSVTLDPWVLHDLRRTVRSHLSALRIPDHICEMALGHGRKGLQRVYDQHRYLDELREALTMWAGRLRSIVEPPPASVVPIRAAG